jgi:hypothetical protein
LFSCENMMVRELLRAPVSLESISVTSDLWTEGEAPYALSPAFEPGITEYEVTVPFETTEVHFRGTPRQRASVRYAAEDGPAELRSGVFAYTGHEDRVFIVTAWEEYMDDTHYKIRVKRESPQVYLVDLSVRHGISEADPGLMSIFEDRRGGFNPSMTEYEAGIANEARRIFIRVKPRTENGVTAGLAFAYTGGDGQTIEPEEWMDGDYHLYAIPFPEGAAGGTCIITTAMSGRISTPYTLTIVREPGMARLTGLSITTHTESGGTYSGPIDTLSPPEFDKTNMNYEGVVKEDKSYYIRIKADPPAWPESYVEYSIDPNTVAEPLDGGTSDGHMVRNGSIRFKFVMAKYRITIRVHSGDPTLEDSYYTVLLIREGLYTLRIPLDGDGQVRTLNASGNVVDNSIKEQLITLTVKANLGYDIGRVWQTAADGGGSLPEEDITGSVVYPANYNDDTKTYRYTFLMPEAHLNFRVEYTPVEPVSKVAYVSSEGWNKNTGEAYGAAFTDKYDNPRNGLATSWGTASNDLQAVINSWTGPGGNFDEIWVHGTVTPKTEANINGCQITSSDPKDLAFVIPPGLKIYGGFKGTESAGAGPGQFPGPISLNPDANDKRNKPTPDNSQDWRLRTVLSGAITQTTNTYHVVIMADIPDDQQTLLDGLTISGGMGAGSPDTITVKGYKIDKQSGAGMYLVNASPVLNNVRIQGNIARKNGGGIYNRATGGGTSSPRLTNTVVYNNTVSGNGSGGGMYNYANGANSTCNPVISGVLFDTNNTTVFGGGMYNEATYDNFTMCAPVIGGGTIFRGNGASQGGGVYNGSYSSPKFNNVSIESNTAGNYGGGVFQNDRAKQVLIKNTTIAGNIANGYGGGISVATNGRLELVNVTIAGNRSAGGGGIYGSRAVIAMSNIIIKDNYSSGSGGGIFLENYTTGVNDRMAVFIGNGRITGNRANSGNGGGVNVTSYTTNGNSVVLYLALTNVLIAKNHAGGSGGGIFYKNDTPITGTTAGYGVKSRLTNVSIANNTIGSGDGNGGGLWTIGASGYNHVEVKVYNSVIWGNKKEKEEEEEVANNIVDPSGRITWHKSLVEGKSLGGTNHSSSANPLDDDYKLRSDASALINGGDDDNTTSPIPATSYRYFESKTSGSGDAATTDVTAILKEATATDFNWGNMSGHLDNIKKMVGRMVTRLSSDAAAAQGDLTHTVTVTGTVGTGMTVTVTDTTIPPATNIRIQGARIDVGAYEKQ